MKTKVIRGTDRGKADYGWLKARYLYSFAQYYDPSRLQFGALRVLNDDIVQRGAGFGMHPHRDMEIITIPLKGSLKHRDSMSNTWIPLRVGEVQVMSAGTGIVHSEMNNSSTEELSLFQIWIEPEKMGVEPRYDQKTFDPKDRKDALQYLVSGMDETYNGSLKIHRDALIARADVSGGRSFTYPVTKSGRGVLVMVISGSIESAGSRLETRDALEVANAEQIELNALTDAELLFIEVPL
jgi:redox-sensitive bicupin YhaK (pirin superfamily)